MEADGKFFVGMSNKSGNIYPPNQLTIFGDEDDISKPVIITLPEWGDIQTMVYDDMNDKVYIELSNNSALKLYVVNPHTYAIATILSTTTVDAGRKPAITTDGEYIYGITDTAPSTVYKVKISDGSLTVNTQGHVFYGHSAAIAKYGSAQGTTTELYFGGGMGNGFEKTNALTLAPISAIQVAPCAMSDDMPFVRTSGSGGYVYIGCEIVPYGLRIRTSDMRVERFSLPGASFGFFAFGTDIYNAAQDGHIDVFLNGDLRFLSRYKVTDEKSPFDTKGQDLEVNELLREPSTGKIYFTAWLGIPGLHEVATSTP
ncbi:MAG: hypothetical protein JWO00_228 [Candidatus Parcubacteria bacterium]|nr:hypothetical protein [Candidatus Parcubacteria bacterium]